MDESVFELAARIREARAKDLDQTIAIAVRYSLEQILGHRKILGRLINGSVADAVVRESGRSVLLVRPPR